MPFTYTSIFDGPNIITKKDLCELLNLDMSRPNLSFSASEINKAYKARALRFHPDTQNRYTPAIPESVCNLLINDIVLARDYMLNDEDNIPGKAFKDKLSTFESKDWADIFTNMFKATKEGTATIAQTVDWIYFFSSSLLVLIPLSTYSDGQLNFRYINTFANELAAIRPYLEHIEGSSVAVFCLFLRDYLSSAEQIKPDEIIAYLKEVSPELLDFLIEQNKLDVLIQAISEAGEELKNTLTDEFIDKVHYIVCFWPQLIANMPTWKNIMSVYFISTLFTATSLPKFFNALKVISEVIIQHQGLIPFLISAIPLLLLSALMLPINLALQLTLPLTWIALKASFQIITNGFLVLFSGINLLFSVLPNNNKSITHEAFSLFEGSFNLIVRLSLNIVIEALDSVIFILSNNNLFSSLQESMNEQFDTMLDSMRPEIKPNETINTDDQFALILANEPALKPRVQAPKPAQEYSFFPNSKFLNEEDIWLNNLLQGFSTQEQSIPKAVNNFTV